MIARQDWKKYTQYYTNKITVGEAQVIDSVKHIEITIYYRFVGAVNIT